MSSRSPLVIAILAIITAGCGHAVRSTVGPAEPPSAPRLTAVSAQVQGGYLVVSVHTDRPLLDLRGSDMQVFVDTDEDASTGYGAHGDEFVARMVESQDATRFPVRRTLPADPNDAAGWGTVTGTGWIGTRDLGPVLRIPLAALGDDDGRVRVRVEMYSGGAFDYRDASTDPGIAAAE